MAKEVKAQGTATAAAETKPYTVRKNLRHDGKGFAPNSTVQLTDKDAAPLLRAGVVAVPAQAPAPAKEAK